MSNNLEFVRREDPQRWDAFVARSPQRSIFVQTRFLDLLGAAYDLATCREGGEIVAGAVVLRGADGAPIDAAFPFTQYQGVMFADHTGLKPHSRVAREFKLMEFFLPQLESFCGHVCLNHSWRVDDLRAFQWHNYHQPDKARFDIGLRYSAVLSDTDYGNFDDFLGAVRTVRRQEFNKAAKALRIVTGLDLPTLSDLYRDTFARQHIAVPESEMGLLRSIVQGASEQGFGQMACAMLGDEAISAVYFLYDDRTAYYLLGANDPEHRKMFGGTFLVMSMIRDAFDRGMSEVDLVGANSPNRGDFKLSLNATLRPYFVTTL